MTLYILLVFLVFVGFSIGFYMWRTSIEVIHFYKFRCYLRYIFRDIWRDLETFTDVIFRDIIYEIFKRFVYIDFVWFIFRCLFKVDILLICFYSILYQRNIFSPPEINHNRHAFLVSGGKCGSLNFSPVLYCYTPWRQKTWRFFQSILVQCCIAIPPENRKSKDFVFRRYSNVTLGWNELI